MIATNEQMARTVQAACDTIKADKERIQSLEHDNRVLAKQVLMLEQDNERLRKTK